MKPKLEELQQFLAYNYVGDKLGKSRFGYSYEFLNWWLTSQSNNISIGLRVCKQDLSEEDEQLTKDLNDGELAGYISGVPMNYTFGDLEKVG